MRIAKNADEVDYDFVEFCLSKKSNYLHMV